MLKYVKNITSVENDNHGHQHMYKCEKSLLVCLTASIFKLIDQDQPHNCGTNWYGNIRKMLKKRLFHCFKRFSLKIKC